MADQASLAGAMPEVARIRLRLGIMLFFVYFALGATWPVMSLYMRAHLGFSGAEIGSVLATASLAAFAFPVVAAAVADRLISKERMLAVCQGLASGAVLALSFQHRYVPFLLLYMLHSVAMGSSIALASAIAFHHLRERRHRFGGLRVWGTVGWIAIAWSFAGWMRTGGLGTGARLGHALLLSSGASAVLALYALTLPRAPRLPPVGAPLLRQILPLDALRVVLRREVLLACLVTFLFALVHRVYSFGAGPFLKAQGYTEAAVMPMLSVGQLSEIGAMCFLGTALLRLGARGTIAIGALFAAWQAFALAVGGSSALVLSGIACHGPVFTFMSIAALVYVDGFCGTSERAGVHQALTMANTGFGSLVGNLLAGLLLDAVTADGVTDFRAYWVVPCALALATLGFVLCCFPRQASPRTESD